MRIKRVEIDGFKSYAQRQIIDGFDAQFNAITGLNGSGKSNILDAICFVLGISNLSQVRAAQLSDLVYKQGQAGIAKATVTVTFDNTDPSNRPVGYEKYEEIVVRRQIIINGRNTYTLNGTAATNSRVADLFRSVGLNVNNPHFLIMQGRITKVLNMKPMEILGMIEEAAGTRMYEAKKQSALRTIEKKEGKMAEIKQVMEEDILPQVEKLKRDRCDYLEYQRIDREVELLERKLVAFDFLTSQSRSCKLEKAIEEILEEIGNNDAFIDEKKLQLTKKEEMLKELEEDREKRYGDRRKSIEHRVKKQSSLLTSVESQRDALVDKIKEMKIAISRKMKSINTDKKELEKKLGDLKKMESISGGEEKHGKNAEETVRKARNKLEAIAKGMTTDEEGHVISLDAQLTAQRSALCDLDTKLKTAEMKLKNLESSLSKKRRELGSLERKSGSNEKLKLERELHKVEMELKNLNYNKDDEIGLINERRTIVAEKRKICDEMDVFEARNQNLKFDYKNPCANFDRRLVKGVIANLFTINDMRFATALEVAAGSNVSLFIFHRNFC
ncbi:unnamed protein product [Dracunculus medinensis]|uniref:SMC_N domain-containing protein n=1 Tax=Dracunculus medinensis TaxID=318479 RepID=A0A158Q4Z7_DRAME|nr:unnamed protein product [Dracunculus medinensis]